MPSLAPTVVILGTGGTIAGTGAHAQDHTRYQAGALTAQQLVSAVPALATHAIEAHSLVQIDSCDMEHATWVVLAREIQRHSARADVAGIVVTHGTDTLEETACFLHHTLRADKPVVLTAAMRPATAASPDGPQNLLDAVMLAGGSAARGVRGVLAVLGGSVYGADALRKVHGYRVDAFSGGDAGPLALVQDGRLRLLRAWPTGEPAFEAVLQADPAAWPVVDIVTSHAGARGATLRALVQAGARGIVIAGTGNGSVHASLLQAAVQALQQGVAVRRASRCVLGGVIDGDAPADVARWAGGIPPAGDATPAQTRVRLMLELALRDGVS